MYRQYPNKKYKNRYFTFLRRKSGKMKKLAMGAGPSQFSRVCTIHATDLNNTSWAVLFETPFDRVCGKFVCACRLCVLVSI